MSDTQGFIIDAHTHIGDIFAGSFSQFFPTLSKKIKYRNIIFGKLNILFIKYMKKDMLLQSRNAKQGQLLASMSKCHINRAVIVAIEPFVSSELIISMAKQNSHFLPFCSLNPKYKQDKEFVLKGYISSGCKGIKLHPVLQDFYPTDSGAYELYDICQTLRLPVLFHTGFIPSGNNTNAIIENFKNIPRDFPYLKIILGHMNMFEPKKAIRYAMMYNNVYLETSKQPSFYIKKALKKLGSEKIIFGSDWPFGDQDVAVQIIKDTVKNETAREKIFYSNILNLLRN